MKACCSTMTDKVNKKEREERFEEENARMT